MAEAQLNRFWKSTGLKIERIVPDAARPSAAGASGAGSGKLTRQLKTVESIFRKEPHLLPGGGGAAAAARKRGAAAAREPRESDASKYGPVQSVDAREDLYPVAPAQLQRARDLELPERRLAIFRASANAYKQQRRSPLSRCVHPTAVPEPGPALRHAPGPSALVR